MSHAPKLHKLQRDFLAAVLLDGPQENLLPAIATSPQLSPAQRLQIYRNNVHLILKGTLQNIFSVTCKLVDKRFFDYAAYEFICQNPPQTGDMNNYGADFPAFLKQFKPMQNYLFGADVAAIEWQRNLSYRAAENTPTNAEDLKQMGEKELSSLRLTLAPHAFIFSSGFPAGSIWKAVCADKEPNVDMSQSEHVLTYRHHLNIYSEVIPPADAMLLQSLTNHTTFHEAVQKVTEEYPDLNIERFLETYLNLTQKETA